MNTKTSTKPTIWVIVRRYDEPLRYGYHEWTFRVSEYSTTGEPRYIEGIPALLNPEKSTEALSELHGDGFVEYTGSWNEELERIVANSCPIEFLKGLKGREPNVMDRITILTRGESEDDRPEKVYGMCTSCGAIEVELVNGVQGTKDLSRMGESPIYPYGYGCEVCS